MSFTQDFISSSLQEHRLWLEKVAYVISSLELSPSWKHDLSISNSELSALMQHLKIEIFKDDRSVYSELRYEYEFVAETIAKMYKLADMIFILIEIIKRKNLTDGSLNCIKSTIEVISSELYSMSTDIITRLTVWQEINKTDK